MWTRNYDYLNHFSKNIANKIYDYDRYYFVNYMGTRVSVYNSQDDNTLKYVLPMCKGWTHTNIASLSNYGLTLEIGGGDTPESYEDFDLAARFTASHVNKVSPCVMGDVEYVWETGVYKQWVEIDFKNITTEDLLVKEYGVYMRNNSQVMLIYRKVLDEPVIIPTGQYYKVRFDYEYEGRSINDKLEIADSWETIIENVKNGTAASLYSVGMYRPVTFTLKDGTNVQAMVQIVGINHDNLSDNSGKATLTWMLKDIWESPQMHSTASTNVGWEGCELRAYLNDILFETLPDVLKNEIKAVSKLSDAKKDGINQLVTTVDKIWIPSLEEMGLTSTSSSLVPGQGEAYSMFDSDRTRIKWKSRSATNYWTRSRNISYSSDAWHISSTGSYSYTSWRNTYGMVFGFCI